MNTASSRGLGKIYEDGEVIIRQGEKGDCMYVVQEGQVQILREESGNEIPLRIASTGELLGEMAIFEHEVRSATVRASGSVRVLTIDKKNFLARIQEDPTLAFRILETMSKRIRELSNKLARPGR